MTSKERLHELVDALPPSQHDPALQMLDGLLVGRSQFDGAPGLDQRRALNTSFEDRFRDAINSYHQNTRFKDPFVQWFQEAIAEPHKNDVTLRVLLILIDARFDQLTPAESALKNTKAIYKAGILMRESLSAREVPTLKAPRFKQPERWREGFLSALPKLKSLALKIVERGEWLAAELLSVIKQAQVEGMGEKTRRLALRWIHDLVPEVSVDMSSASVPVDRLLYRVVARLGVLDDPKRQRYAGAGSPADLAIQEFARRISEENPCVIDEPCWMMAREYCRKVSPKCEYGCIFRSFCPKNLRDRDPVEIGYHPAKQLPVINTPVAESVQLKGALTQHTAGLIIVSCVKTKIWDTNANAPHRVPAGRAYAGALFEKSRAYARKFGKRWCVFSAKYGFVLPEEEIENYNATFKLKSPDLVDLQTLRTQVGEKELHLCRGVTILGGREYVRLATAAFSSYGVPVSDPTYGLKFGPRLQWLNNRLRSRDRGRP
jgi:hypothetical protein